MAQRPRQHALELESRNAFSSVLPSKWVVNSPQHDYGIDLEVQIFENGSSTPYFFFVQLKATDKDIAKARPSFVFSSERLLEYEQYPLPVLLAVYYSKAKTLFFRWTHDLLAELAIERGIDFKEKKKLTVHFETQLDSDNCEMVLSEDVREYFFINGMQPEDVEKVKVQLRLSVDEHTQTQIEERLKNWLWSKKDFDFITIGNFENADFHIDGIHEWNAITVTSKSKKIAYPFLEDAKDGDVPDLILNSLKIVLADTIAQTGRRNTALDIITQYVLDATPINSTASFIFNQPSWAIQYSLSKRNLEALEIADTLVTSENPYFGKFLAFVSQLNGNSSLVTKKYRDFCIKAVEAAKDSKQKGIESYNLAASFRSENLFRQAVIPYCRAAKFAPGYLEKSYWWAEIAGCLFLTEKYRWAENGYRRAIELGEERMPGRYLLGDCLLHQGRFSEASTETTRYLKDVNRPFAGAILQKWMADFLFAHFGDSKRNPTGANEQIEKGLNLEDIEERKEIFFQALQDDPLSGWAWYCYRICEGQLSEELNFNTWLASILTNPNDTVSWAYFVVLMLFEFSESEKLGNRFQLAVLSEAWKDKLRIEDAIRKNVPVDLAAAFYEQVEPLIQQAEIAFSQEPPVLMRSF